MNSIHGHCGSFSETYPPFRLSYKLKGIHNTRGASILLNDSMTSLDRFLLRLYPYQEPKIDGKLSA